MIYKKGNVLGPISELVNVRYSDAIQERFISQTILMLWIYILIVKILKVKWSSQGRIQPNWVRHHQTEPYMRYHDTHDTLDKIHQVDLNTTAIWVSTPPISITFPLICGGILQRWFRHALSSSMLRGLPAYFLFFK